MADPIDRTATGTPTRDRPGVGTYLTDEEAKEIHGAFMGTFGLYVAIAVVAHILIWINKPWLPI